MLALRSVLDLIRGHRRPGGTTALGGCPGGCRVFGTINPGQVLRLGGWTLEARPSVLGPSVCELVFSHEVTGTVLRVTPVAPAGAAYQCTSGTMLPEKGKSEIRNPKSEVSNPKSEIRNGQLEMGNGQFPPVLDQASNLRNLMANEGSGI